MCVVSSCCFSGVRCSQAALRLNQKTSGELTERIGDHFSYVNVCSKNDPVLKLINADNEILRKYLADLREIRYDERHKRQNPRTSRFNLAEETRHYGGMTKPWENYSFMHFQYQIISAICAGMSD